MTTTVETTAIQRGMRILSVNGYRLDGTLPAVVVAFAGTTTVMDYLEHIYDLDNGRRLYLDPGRARTVVVDDACVSCGVEWGNHPMHGCPPHGDLTSAPAHSDYPHEHGRLPDCPACEAECHCSRRVPLGWETPCVAADHRYILPPDAPDGAPTFTPGGTVKGWLILAVVPDLTPETGGIRGYVIAAESPDGETLTARVRRLNDSSWSHGDYRRAVGVPDYTRRMLAVAEAMARATVYGERPALRTAITDMCAYLGGD